MLVCVAENVREIIGIEIRGNHPLEGTGSRGTLQNCIFITHAAPSSRHCYKVLIHKYKAMAARILL